MICITQDCNDAAVTRGLCRNCYMSAWRMVRTGKITWEKLVAGGYVSKATNSGNSPGKFRRSLQPLDKIESIPQSLDDDLVYEGGNEALMFGVPNKALLFGVPNEALPNALYED